MATKAEISLQAIIQQGVLPLYYDTDPLICLAITEALYRAGIRVIEFTRRGPAALDNFSFLKSKAATAFPDLQLGIGTIKSSREAEEFLRAGADFIVCPVVDMAIGDKVHEAGLLWIPGCFTPTEINQAYQRKAGLIKIFPAQFFGPEYLTAIKDIFPGQLFMPTGGVEMEQAQLESWFKAGVSAVGIGSKLITKEIINQNQYDMLQIKTAALLQMVSKAR